MIIIFLFSAKPADSSNESSKTIANLVLDISESLNIMDEPLQEPEREYVLDYINHVVRKLAHFTEFAILALAVEFHNWIQKRKGARLILLSIGITVLYAASDEFHQLFVPGRSGEVKDVLIDSAGAVTGALLFYLALRLYENYRKTKIQSEECN